ncbi:sensor histidine kinase [Roseomonas rosulenta]|uniref:hypothetical protein n=1 Tax=Roseomonas rosulenta TaxID=2748667 RepID=UPI0018DFE8FF|nr:hypothetical protein [Roseomonas rosulenta]
MTVHMQFRLPSRMPLSDGRAASLEHDDPAARELLRELRDMLFVVAGATSDVLPGVDPDSAAVLDRVLNATKRASDCARRLAEVIDARTGTRTRISFDTNARLRALQPTLDALLPPGGALRLRLAAGLWRSQGDPGCFDDAVTMLVRRAADAMRRQEHAAPIAILTRNRASAPPNGQVRVSIVSDISWVSDVSTCDRDFRDVCDALARCDGRLLGNDLHGLRGVAHIDLRRSWSQR